MIINDIREHLSTYISNGVFSYGRAFDTALASANIEIDEWFIHLDPITERGKLNESTLLYDVGIGFLKQDKPDSSYDEAENMDIDPSIETIQKEAYVKAKAWLGDFLDNYPYSDGDFNITPVTRIKNVMSGCFLKVTLSGKSSC